MSGYETDSNRSYFEQGADSMMIHPVRDLPDRELRRFIRDTSEVRRYPEEAGIQGDAPGNAEIRQV